MQQRKHVICIVIVRMYIRKSFNWHSLSTSQFPLHVAQRAMLPWHLSGFFIWCFIMWPFSTLWVCRYNFLLYSRFYGWLCCWLHPEGLFPRKVIVILFVRWLSLKKLSRLESRYLKKINVQKRFIVCRFRFPLKKMNLLTTTNLCLLFSVIYLFILLIWSKP